MDRLWEVGIIKGGVSGKLTPLNWIVSWKLAPVSEQWFESLIGQSLGRWYLLGGVSGKLMPLNEQSVESWSL